jgi:transposase
VPTPYPQEFREDVVRGAWNRASGVMIEQIAADFGVQPMPLTIWLRRPAVENGDRVLTTRAESDEVRNCGGGTGSSSRKSRCSGVLLRFCRRRTCREKALPSLERARHRRDPRRGDVPGSQACPPALLPVAGSSRFVQRGGARVSGERVARRAPGRSRVRVPAPRRRGPRRGLDVMSRDVVSSAGR